MYAVMLRKNKVIGSAVFRLALIAGLVWTIVLFALCGWNVRNEKRLSNEVAIFQARAFFQEIVTTRYWNASHGGVYVPITEDVQPNPFLDDPDRDIITVNGLALTKINPAYMTRQIAELASVRNLVWFHITSSNPIRPANAADSWELAALKSFMSTSQEYSQFIESDDGKKVFRYMAPLWVERPCLKCHAKQGYKEGDLRGGISISIQADPIVAAQHRKVRNLILAYTVIWLLGLLGVGIGFFRLVRGEEKRKRIIIQLQNALGKVKTLSGLLPICCSCKKIRDDKGYWNQIEAYIQDHSEAEFSHSICPKCAERLYPELHSTEN